MSANEARFSVSSLHLVLSIQSNAFKMVALVKIALASLLSGAIAAPTLLELRQETPFSQSSSAWNAGAVAQYPIHSSCNATQAHQIELGLNETIGLAEHAKEHVLRWGNASETYRRYFGNRPSYEVIGAFDIIISGDKSNTLFRCDNPDGNCELEGNLMRGAKDFAD